MSNVTTTARASTVLPTTATVYNFSATLAATEYSQALNSETKQFLIRCRGDSTIQLAFNSGESSTDFVTIPKGSALTFTQINFSGTLYFQVDKAAQIVEIVEWA